MFPAQTNTSELWNYFQDGGLKLFSNSYLVSPCFLCFFLLNSWQHQISKTLEIKISKDETESWVLESLYTKNHE